MAKKKSCSKCGGKDPCSKCAEIKKRKRARQPKVIRLKSKQAPVIINLQQPTAPYLPSLANQYMNMPFQGPPMGNQLARRVVPAVIPDDYIEPVGIVRAPSVQSSIRDSISDISDVSQESYGYAGSLPSLFSSEQSVRDYESLPSAPYQYPPSYPPSYFQLPIQPPMPAFEPIGRQSNNLPSAPISLVDDFGSSPIREEDFTDESISEKSASIQSAKSDITIPPSLFEERTFVPAAEPILPSIGGIYDEPIEKPISAEIPTAVAMPISKGEDITPIKAVNPALVEKLNEGDIRALNTFEEIKSMKKSERTPEQEKDFKRAQYLQTQQRDKVDAFRMSELYQPTYTPEKEKLAVGGGGGEGPILAEKVDDFSNYTAQDRSDLETYYREIRDNKKDRTPEQKQIAARVATLKRRKNYDAFLNSGKVIAGGIPVASELFPDESEKEPFFFEDKPITGSVAFNIPKPITTKRQPSVFEKRATVIPESFEDFPTEVAPLPPVDEDEDEDEDTGEFAFDEDGAKITIQRDADGDGYAVDPSDGNTYAIYDAEDENGNPYSYWEDAAGNEHKLFFEDENEDENEELEEDEDEDYAEYRKMEEKTNIDGLYEELDRAGINPDEPITMDDVYRFEMQLDKSDDLLKDFQTRYCREKYYEDMNRILDGNKTKILPSTRDILKKIYDYRRSIEEGENEIIGEWSFRQGLEKMIAAQRPTPAPTPAPTFSLLAPPLKISPTPTPKPTVPEDY